MSLRLSSASASSALLSLISGGLVGGMDLILCHTTADFDALGAAVGLTRLRTGAKVVLTGGSHPTVRDFLALHRDEYPLIERRAVNPQQIRSLTVVDTQKRDRLGKASEWLDLLHLEEIMVYDHHLNAEIDIPATRTQIEPVGATTTLIAELLQQEQIQLTPVEATVMALGIHVDTGSLTFEGSTPRDAIALAWLMQQGASLAVVADYIEPGLSPQLQELLSVAMEKLETENLQGYQVSWVMLETDNFVPGLSSLASRLIDLTESDALLLANVYQLGEGSGRAGGARGAGGAGEAGEAGGENIILTRNLTTNNSQHSPVNSQQSTVNNPKLDQRLIVIGRSRIDGTNLNELFKPLGGGGHSQAASVTLRGSNHQQTLNELVEKFKQQIPQPPSARELMSSPVRTIRSETTIDQAQRILLRYGHSGLSVVDEGQLVGIISRRDIDLALHHGFSHAPVKGYMTTNVKTITPDTLLPEIESLMVTYDIGRLPVLEKEQLVGIVTRTDVLRQLHQEKERGREREEETTGKELLYCPLPQSIKQLRDRLAPSLRELLIKASELAEQKGWHLYLVGGAIRDLLLAGSNDVLMIEDIDLVVDGFHRAADVGAGVELAKELQKLYPETRLEVHGQFQTAALLWHKDPSLGSLWVDIATARTEFYPYPAANPEVEASSIRQDLYRRDFTINALAVRLTRNWRMGTGNLVPTNEYSLPLLDFFGGLLDLQAKQIRVLHANSFIEDPTRIYRAVRFAVRLGFKIEPQTEAYIRNAIASGIYARIQGGNSKAPALETRLKSELKYILQAPYWKPALRLLADLEALKCIHPTLELDKDLWRQICLLSHCLHQFDPHKSLEPWQIRLELLIAYLSPDYRGKVATNLQLSEDSIERLHKLAQAKAEVAESLSQCQRPSEIVRSLRGYGLPTLILIAVQSQRPLRWQIWRYLTFWSHVKAPLNGNDLKNLGYKPGPQFKEILDTLLAATLDGEVGTGKEPLEEIRDEAINFIAKKFSSKIIPMQQ